MLKDNLSHHQHIHHNHLYRRPYPHCGCDHDYNQGDLEREVNELEERAAEAAKLIEPRENSYIEFRVMMMLLMMMLMLMMLLMMMKCD